MSGPRLSAVEKGITQRILERYERRGLDGDRLEGKLREVLERCDPAVLPSLERHLCCLHEPLKYLSLFGAADVLDHLAFLAGVTPSTPVVVRVRPSGREAGLIRVTVAGLDRRGICSAITGVLARQGFDIRQMEVMTYGKETGAADAPGVSKRDAALKFLIDFCLVAERARPRGEGAASLQRGLQRDLVDAYGRLGRGEFAGVARGGWGRGAAAFLVASLLLVLLGYGSSLCPYLFPERFIGQPRPHLLVVIGLTLAGGFLACCSGGAIALFCERRRQGKLLRESRTAVLEVFVRSCPRGGLDEAAARRTGDTLRKLAYLGGNPEAGNQTCLELANTFDSDPALTSLSSPRIMPGAPRSQIAQADAIGGNETTDPTGGGLMPREGEGPRAEEKELLAECVRLRRQVEELLEERERSRQAVAALEAERARYLRSLYAWVRKQVTEEDLGRYARESAEALERLAGGQTLGPTFDELLGELGERPG